jgi:antitoxin (DNA-binding transcriptional repressor) of toxin-antitoxin stability system
MKTMTITEVARNFNVVIDRVISEQEEIILIRNRKPVARLVPEPQNATALEVLGDLASTLDDETADALTEALRKKSPSNANRDQKRRAVRTARMVVDRHSI